MRGLAVLRRHGVQWNARCTVPAGNADAPLAVDRFLRDEASASFTQFIPIVERADREGHQRGDALTERSVDGKPGHNHLCAGYEAFLLRSAPAMRAMAEAWQAGRPPAEAVAARLHALRPRLAE